jgi:hypothetical protein
MDIWSSIRQLKKDISKGPTKFETENNKISDSLNLRKSSLKSLSPEILVE